MVAGLVQPLISAVLDGPWDAGLGCASEGVPWLALNAASHADLGQTDVVGAFVLYACERPTADPVRGVGLSAVALDAGSPGGAWDVVNGETSCLVVRGGCADEVEEAEK